MKPDIRFTAPALAEKLGLSESEWEPFGRYTGKIELSALARVKTQAKGNLILVTAMSPTPAGEGKTTMAIGVHDALCRLGKRSLACLRQPSLGPVFGQKGGATGGGKSQLFPMEDINLAFTGDFSAIENANNLLAALIDNHIHQGNVLQIDPATVTWRRVLDMNDRALRQVVTGLGEGNGTARETGFNIVAASEVMAVLCLASSLDDLRTRLSRLVIGRTFLGTPVTAYELGAVGAMMALLRHAIKPNIVQTLEGNPAIVHGGPFANIAHGCSSILSTEVGLHLADYVVTEAGFGADLGAEKFIDIKCRKSGLWPAASVVVATIRALKYHGGVKVRDLEKEDMGALDLGVANLERHVQNLKSLFGLSVVVAINRFPSDTPKEIAHLEAQGARWGVPVILAEPWGVGGAGCETVAKAILSQIESAASTGPKFLYEDTDPLLKKIESIAKKVYRASSLNIPKKVKDALLRFEKQGFGHLPICIAKTQYSFSSDSKLRGAPENHTLEVEDVRLSAGAGFIVAICGDMVLMPGLPKVPASEEIDVTDAGMVTGL